MFLISVTLVDTAHPALPDAALVTDVFWSLSTPADGVLQHVRLAAQARIELVAFLRARDETEAVSRVRRLCDRVISSSPYLKGWEIQSVGPVELTTGEG